MFILHIYPLLWTELCPLNVTIFGNRAFKEVIKVKRGHKGGALIQYDWCPYKKKERDQGCRSTEKRSCEDTLKRQPSASHGGDLRRNQTCQQLDLGLLAFKTVRKYICLFFLSHPVCGIFVMTALAF